MTDLDLEAIKARALAADGASGGLPWEVVNDVMVAAIERNPRDGSIESGGKIASTHNSDLSAHIAGMDPETTLALIGRIKRLGAAWVDAATSGEWAAFQLEELRDALRGTLGDDE